jgi:HD-GYP domain-containing protein (c-di-GMP phosphodiesterase class II)
MFEYRDSLDPLNENISLREKLRNIHGVINQSLPFVARIAIVIYDPKTEVIKTYIDSSGDVDPLSNYQAKLEDAPSLKEILSKRRPRVVNNMLTFEKGEHEHTKRIGRQGYAASYTLPMFYNGVFFGFIFFNSYETDVFDEKSLHHLDVFGHMISLLVINELSNMRTLLAAVKTTSDIIHCRDPETGSHLDRMSRYSRLIARVLADKYDLDDDYIEHVFMFSPLHDIGKISIPDNILLKPGALDENEKEVMKTHSTRGREIIDNMLKNFGLDTIQHIDVLRNIAEYHHEAVNGSGYPEGMKNNEIPLEARIVAVADVFDALTSRRPYKDPWTNDEAFATLRQLSGDTLDKDCVDAMVNNVAEIEEIQQQFKEDLLG